MKTHTGRSHRLFVALIMLVVTVVPARGSTFVRLGLDDLTAGSSTVVLGEVIDSHSYWSPDSSMILTDVLVVPSRVLKGGDPGGDELAPMVVTVLGGTVGELTSLIVGGAELEPGRSYVLFLGEESLAGAEKVRTVREHGQGVFEIRSSAGRLRAVSQATGHLVLPGRGGESEPPGGSAGLDLEDLMRQIEALAHPASRR